MLTLQNCFCLHFVFPIHHSQINLFTSCNLYFLSVIIQLLYVVCISKPNQAHPLIKAANRYHHEFGHVMQLLKISIKSKNKVIVSMGS